MKFVKIKPDYLTFLRSLDNNVRTKKDRPYIGIIFKVNNFNYFAPLASPKPKHKTMRDNLDFLKINDGKLGVIDLANMVPVPPSKIEVLNFKDYKVQDQELFKQQHRYINRMKKKIYKNSEKLYSLCENKKEPFFSRCVNFKLIESRINLDFDKAYEKDNYTLNTDRLIEKINEMLDVTKTTVKKTTIQMDDLDID